MAGMERFTARARRVLSLAHQEAERASLDRIGTEHLLLGLLQEDGGVASRVLRDLGLEEDRVKDMILRLSDQRPEGSGQIELGDDTQAVLEAAIEEARRMGHHYIGTEHLLLGLVNANVGLAMEVLKHLGVTEEQIRRQTRRVLQESSSSSAGPATAGKAPPQKKEEEKASKSKTPLVDQLAVDLTTKAEEEKLDPVSRSPDGN